MRLEETIVNNIVEIEACERDLTPSQRKYQLANLHLQYESLMKCKELGVVENVTIRQLSLLIAVYETLETLPYQVNVNSEGAN